MGKEGESGIDYYTSSVNLTSCPMGMFAACLCFLLTLVPFDDEAVPSLLLFMRFLRVPCGHGFIALPVTQYVWAQK